MDDEINVGLETYRSIHGFSAESARDLLGGNVLATIVMTSEGDTITLRTHLGDEEMNELAQILQTFLAVVEDHMEREGIERVTTTNQLEYMGEKVIKGGA